MLRFIEKIDVSFLIPDTSTEQTIDRRKAYFILEQFYEQIRDKENKSDVERHLEEYFAEPENTEFFEKNKIK